MSFWKIFYSLAASFVLALPSAFAESKVQLPSCYVQSENGKIAPLATRFKPDHPYDFRERSGTESSQLDAAQELDLRGCKVGAQIPRVMRNPEDQYQVAIAFDLLATARDLQLKGSKEQLRRMAEIRKCLNGSVKSDECEQDKKNVVAAIQEKVAEMRQNLAIALGGPCGDNGVVEVFKKTESNGCLLDPKISHKKQFQQWYRSLFSPDDPLEPEALTADETKAANRYMRERADEARYKKLLGIRDMYGPNENLYSQRLMIGRELDGKAGAAIEQARVDATDRYRTLISQIPLLKFIRSAKPGEKEILFALGKVEARATTVDAELQKKRMAEYAEPVFLENVIQQTEYSKRGDYCFVAQQLLKDRESQSKGQAVALGVLTVGTMGYGVPVALASGALVSSGLAYQAYSELDKQSLFCSSDLDGTVRAKGTTNCDADKFKKAQSDFDYALLMGAVSTVGGGGTQSARRLLRQFRVERKIADPFRLGERGKLLATDTAEYITATRASLMVRVDEVFPATAKDGSSVLARKIMQSAIETGESAAELAAVRHQLEITRTAMGKLVKEVGADPGSVRLGMAISDLGKLDKYKNLLKGEPPQASRELFDCLKLSPDCQPAEFLFSMRDYLKRAGHVDEAGRPLAFVNPKQTFEETVSVFKDMPIDVNLNHELGGIAVLMEAAKSKSLTGPEIQRALHVNINHNGPANEGGFWGLASKKIRPVVAESKKGTNPQVMHLHDQTIYARKEGNVYVPDYKTPRPVRMPSLTGRGEEMSLDNVFHTAADRAEGLLMGSTKYVLESKSAGLPMNGMIDSMLTSNAKKTGFQFDDLVQMLKAEAADPKKAYTAQEIAQLQKMSKAIEQLKLRSTRMSEYMTANVKEVTTDIPGKMVQSARRMVYYDDKGRKVVAEVGDEWVRIQRGYSAPEFLTPAKGQRPDFIEKVLAPIVDEMAAWERTHVRVGNLLELLM
ncbi:hypothetical protein K2X30_14420 [bacterium]|nr:hypothetical protein [bacterium]